MHDALLMEVRKPVLKRVVKDVLQAMRHPPLLDVLKIKLRVPILAEVKIGAWGGVDVAQRLIVEAMERARKKLS